MIFKFVSEREPHAALDSFNDQSRKQLFLNAAYYVVYGTGRLRCNSQDSDFRFHSHLRIKRLY